MSAICEYRAKEQPAFPSEASTSFLTLSCERRVTAREAPLSLKVPVGFRVSSFTQTLRKCGNDFTGRRGVSPSPAVAGIVPAFTGRNMWSLLMEETVAPCALEAGVGLLGSFQRTPCHIGSVSENSFRWGLYRDTRISYFDILVRR